MTQSLPSPDGFLLTIVLATLAIGLPILLVLSIRFLWDRKLNLGRSKELEKLIWQLHRIASAMEQQMNSSLAAAQLGSEQPRGLADPQQLPAQATAASRSVTASAGASSPATRSAQVEQREAPALAGRRTAASPPASGEPSAEGHPQGGVNSMFGF